jgi:SAM-dependent methyltransferase
MLMNWPERVWIYSPVRVMFLWLHARKWRRLAGPPPEHASALEIGCGTGRGARILIDVMGFDKVYAFDLDEKCIERAIKGTPDRLRGRISFFVGDAQDFSFADSAFDAVVNYGIIHHVLDWRRCISEIGRVLKPGGLFYFEEIYPPLYANALLGRVVRHPKQDRFDGPQFIGALRANGMDLIEGVKSDSRYGVVGAAEKRPLFDFKDNAHASEDADLPQRNAIADFRRS